MAARGKLARTRGCIVNIASLLSFFGGARVPGYRASKGGIAQLTKSLALAWAADGIRVNAVAPGWIATPLPKSFSRIRFVPHSWYRALLWAVGAEPRKLLALFCFCAPNWLRL